MTGFYDRVEFTDVGCWEWMGARAKGYGSLHLNGRHVMAHRISWELARGPIPEGLNVLHKCDNPPCIRPSHLFLGTQAVNAWDMVLKGRAKRTPLRGIAHPRAKLTDEQVAEMRRLSAAGVSAAELGRRYGVSHAHAHRVVRGQVRAA